jgi:hypothetical protein
MSPAVFLSITITSSSTEEMPNMSAIEGELVEIPPPTKGTSISLSKLYIGLHQSLKLESLENEDKGLELVLRIASLEDELKSTRRENEKMKSSLQSMVAYVQLNSNYLPLRFYKMNCPDFPPPDYIDLSMVGGGWTAALHSQSPAGGRTELLGGNRTVTTSF